MTIEERLESVEHKLNHSQRCYRGLLLGLGLTGIILVVFWGLSVSEVNAQAQADRKIIRANELILEDEYGKCKARFIATSNGAALYFFNVNEYIAAVLGVDKNVPGLHLFDNNQNGRVSLILDNDEPVISLQDASGNDLISLVARADGHGLFLHDKNKELSAMLGVSLMGSMLTLLNNGNTRFVAVVSNDINEVNLCDQNGKQRVSMFEREQGVGFSVKDENEMARAGLVVARDHSALVVSDKNGKVIGSVP